MIGTEYVCSNEGFCRQCNEDKERTGLERAETRVGCKAMIGLKKVMLEKLVLQLIQNPQRKQYKDLLYSWEITYNLEF